MNFHNFSVDVEANGPCAGLYSMIEVGIVNIETNETFIQQFRPLAAAFISHDALNAIGRTHEETMEYPRAIDATEAMYNWVQQFDGRKVFWSDNPAFDWQFVNYYFCCFGHKNPFGFSARRIGDLYAGAVGDRSAHTKWKKLRTHKHTHNALDDALGNAGALRQIFDIVKQTNKEINTRR